MVTPAVFGGIIAGLHPDRVIAAQEHILTGVVVATEVEKHSGLVADHHIAIDVGTRHVVV